MKYYSRLVMSLTMLGLTAAAQAETVYVAERIRLVMRAEVDETSPAVKTIETGVPLEVLERVDRFAQVRDPLGTVGWIEARYLAPDPPARVRVAKLEEELAKSRAQTTEAQAQLKKAQAVLTEQTAKIKDLEQAAEIKPAATSTEVLAQFNKAQSALAEQTARVKELEREISEKAALISAKNLASSATSAWTPSGNPTADAGFSFSFLWLGISFAMLGIGFVAGIKWLRESIRKRSGGMYLRV
jgi:SH3 domain protein